MKIEDIRTMDEVIVINSRDPRRPNGMTAIVLDIKKLAPTYSFSGKDRYEVKCKFKDGHTGAFYPSDLEAKND